MPTQKDFKRLVRRRMQKTGESYTTARAQLLKTRPVRPSGRSARAPSRARGSAPARAPAATLAPGVIETVASAPAKVSPAGYAAIAGMSDAAVKAKTGCTWERWVKALDHHEAHTWSHRQITDFIYEKYKVDGWWAQMVTVGYERIKGLRDRGQRRGGAYEAAKSKTFAVAAAKVFDAFANARARSRWLPGVNLTVRKATPSKSVRITWEDDTSVEVWLTAKGAGKSIAQVQHRKLPDKQAAERMKQYWAERLDALGEVLKA
jgi:uncharacterized protein YndB with AHSA1/START domain